VADLKKDEFGSAVVCAKGVSLDENGSKGTSQEMKLFFKEGALISINVRSPKGAYYTVTPSSMKGSMEITLCREVDLNGADTAYVPISKPFILNAKNASKLTTDYVDIDEIPDIRDIDGDGDKATYKVVVRDIYSTDVNIQNKVNASAGIMYNSYHDWAKDAVGWKYVLKDGTCLKNSWKKVRGSWYYLGKDGYMEKNAYRGGWYVGQSGAWDGKAKAPGWKQDGNGWRYEVSEGMYLHNGWIMIDGKWYYFKTDGYAAQSEFIQGWWLGKNCAWNDPVRYGWHKSGSRWYGVKDGWYAKSTTYTIDGKSCKFDKNGFSFL
jgi:glucan-binding YG repeat protein